MDPEKILLGDSIPLEEVEEENDRDVTGEAEIRYEMADVIEAIGTSEFEEVYNVHIDNIKSQPIENQAFFCRHVLQKIQDEYEYTIMNEVDYSDPDIIKEVYKFLEFIEFNYIEFFSIIWSKLNVDLIKTNIADYVLRNPVPVGEQILRISKDSDIPLFMKDYYNTQTKDELLNLFIEMSIKNKVKIAIKIAEKNSFK